ncbi:TPA: transcriptional regulator [Candidatus Bathyarchaeota archaeon]|nr:transcriptional regulator [Candidatus Bathyarchaeota archaeon]
METGKIEKQDFNVRLTVRRNGLEITVEAPVEKLLSRLDNITELFNRAVESFTVKPQAAAGVIEEVEYPSIKPSRSTTENLQALFNEAWGQTPRSLSEVSKALEVNGVPDSPSNVTVYLKRLVAKGFLRRILKEGKYYYYRIPEGSG